MPKPKIRNMGMTIEIAATKDPNAFYFRICLGLVCHVGEDRSKDYTIQEWKEKINDHEEGGQCYDQHAFMFRAPIPQIRVQESHQRQFFSLP